MLCREYAECKARELQRTRAEAEEAENQLMKLAKDFQHKVRHLCGRHWIHALLAVRPGVVLHPAPQNTRQSEMI